MLGYLTAFTQVQYLIISLQQLCQLRCALDRLISFLVKRGIVYGNVLRLLIQDADFIERLADHSLIAEADHWKRNWSSLIPQLAHLLVYFVNRMVVVGCKQYRTLIEESRHDGVHDGIGFTGSRRPLNVGQRIPHGVVDGKELVQVYLPIHQGQRVLFPPHRPLQVFPKECLYWRCDFSTVIHIQDGSILVLQIQGTVESDGDHIGHVIDAADIGIIPGDIVFYRFHVITL